MKKNRWSILTISILLVLLMQSFAAADSYVSLSGNDNNPGTYDLPFRHVQRGVEAAGSCGYVYIFPGDYNECVYIPQWLFYEINIIGMGQPEETIVSRIYVSSPNPDFAQYLNVSSLTMTGGISFSGISSNPGYISAYNCNIQYGIYGYNVGAHLTNCKFTNCNYDGAVWIDNSNTPYPQNRNCYIQIFNCLFYNNASPQELKLFGTNEYVLGCSFLGNSQDPWHSGGVLYKECATPQSSGPTFINCLFAPNGDTGSLFSVVGHSETKNCCMTYDDYTDTGGFVPHYDAVLYTPNSNNYMDWISNNRLQPASPCVDAGVYPSYGIFDVFGNPRIQQGRVDIGAEEIRGRVHNQTRNLWYNQIGTALGQVQTGDTIVVYPGIYQESLVLNGQAPSTTLNYTVRSTDPDDPNVVASTIIDGGGAASTVTLSYLLQGQFSGFTLTGGLRGATLQSGTGMVLSKCLIRDNATMGVLVGSCSGYISNCVIRDNGDIGVKLEPGAMQVKNTVISGHASGALISLNSGGALINCTIVDNVNYGIYRIGPGSGATITNCILWNNGDDLYDCIATYSCIQDGDAGAGNIWDNPQFINAAGGDYRLALASLCVDRGTDVCVDRGMVVDVSTDIDGKERIKNRRFSTDKYDMGAYECRLFEAGKKTPAGWTYDYVYYGHLHNHCSISDGTGTPDAAYSTAKTNGLDFFGLADHSCDSKFTVNSFASMRAAADTHLQHRVYTTFWGFEWTSDTYGHVAVIRPADATDPNDYCTARNSPTHPLFSDLVGWLDTHDCVAFFNHPGNYNTSGREFEHFSGAFSNKIVGMELWNKSSLFNVFYYNSGYARPDATNRSGYFDEALQNGWRIGAAGSQDHHGSTWGAENAMVAIPANVNTREELYAALQARRFYSTLDKNLMLSFEIDGQPMGSQVGTGLRTITVKAVDSDSEVFTKVELIVNGNVFDTVNLNTANPVITRQLNISEGDYVYCKVTQTDGNEAISSPIFGPPLPRVRFQQGAGGYNSASDTMLHGAYPTKSYATDSIIKVDAFDTGSSSQVVLKFDNIIGAAGIPAGATIVSAVLRLHSRDDNGRDGGNLHAMVMAWTDAWTWNMFNNNGVQADGVEALAAQDGTISSDSQNIDIDFVVTGRVQAWVDGTVTNNGWVILPRSGTTNGWNIGSCNNATAIYRPELIVKYRSN